MMLTDLTWTEAAEQVEQGALLAVPVGSTEQHGPHLPVSTDTDIALELCMRLAFTRADVVVAPAMPYGASGEHAGFAGTLSIGEKALELVLVELGRSALEVFSRMLVVSAHGGNAVAVGRAIAQLQEESRDLLAWTPAWRGDAHAGYVETSLQLALDHTRVRADVAMAGATEPLEQLMPALRAGGVRSVSANGVLGDPGGATAEAGSQFFDDLAADLVATVGQWSGSSGAPA